MLVPLQLLAEDGRCVLVGDPKQLPATLLSRAATTAALAQSLFERLQRVLSLLGPFAGLVAQNYSGCLAASAW